MKGFLNVFLNFIRVFHIYIILIKHDLKEWAKVLNPFKPLNFVFGLPFPFLFFKNTQPRGVRVREALEELGPLFVKFGQILSTRFDMIPEDVLSELSKLQDQVPPFSGTIAKQMIEKALGQKLETVFSKFEIEALASASIAQVHAATLLDGRDVVVKVLRPNIQKLINKDLALLQMMADFCHRFWKESRQFKPREMVAEFEKSLEWELDLTREAASASQLKRNFQNSALLYVPEIVWPLTKNNILVMERIYGIPISNTAALKERGFDLKQIAEQGVEIFFTQVFRDCFFHADMHPGNILISLKNINHPQFIAVDFGIMGSLGPKDQRYLAENFLAFFKRDYRRVAELHLESSWIAKEVRLDEFEASIRTVCEPIFERPIKEISFAQMLLRLFQTAKEFEIDIQPQLILLQKTLMNVEGLGRQLYPDLDLWKTAKPFLENWMKTQVGPKALFKKLKAAGPYWLEKLPELPELLHRVLEQGSFLGGNRELEVSGGNQGGSKTFLDSKLLLLFGILLGLGLSLVTVWFARHF